jgi:hypothetical protein
VAAGVKHGVKVGGAPCDLGQLNCLLPDVGVVLVEVGADGILLEELDGGRVQRGFAALGGRVGQLDLVVKDVPRVGELGLVGTVLVFSHTVAGRARTYQIPANGFAGLGDLGHRGLQDAESVTGAQGSTDDRSSSINSRKHGMSSGVAIRGRRGL